MKIKKKFNFFSSLLLVQLIVLPSVFAFKTIEDCQSSKTTDVAFSQCLDHVKDAVDRELGTWVTNQTFILEEVKLVTGRNSALVMFQRSQNDFITFRENNCRWQYLSISLGVEAVPAYKKCYIKTSQDRIKELSLINNIN
jgi:uncharacterized protein YecT (DUF1311 family)